MHKRSLILYDRSAHRPPKLVVAKSIFGLAHIVKKIPRVQHRVAKIFKYAAVKLIGSAPGDDAYHRAGIPPVLRFKVRKHIQLLNRVLGKYRSGNAKHSALVDRWQIPVPVVHVRAVEQIIIRPAAARRLR